ncbi:hypothetical protein Tco_0828378 [Tanacetum coccineum]
MASESPSQQQPKQLTPTSNVNFEYEDGIIAFNNGIALLESKIPFYQPMLQFLSNCCISAALTKQPSAYYSKYLREFWYTAEVDGATNTITFTLSSFVKPLSFKLNDFSYMIGLKYSENFAPLPPKEIVRAALAILGLFNEKDPSFSSIVLVNSSLLRIRYFSPIWRVLIVYIVKCLGGMQGSHDQLNINQQMIAYSLCWGLDIDIGNILFSDLVIKLTTSNKKKEQNICYTRYLSLIIEHLLGNAYKNDKLKTFKLHHISATTFKTPSASNVALTSHMIKMEKLLPKPEESLILSSKRVNSDDTVDKESSPLKQVTDTQHAEEPVATANTTKSVDASESAEVLGNRTKPADAEKVHEKIIEEEVEDPLATYSGIRSLRNISFEELKFIKK